MEVLASLSSVVDVVSRSEYWNVGIQWLLLLQRIPLFPWLYIGQCLSNCLKLKPVFQDEGWIVNMIVTVLSGKIGNILAYNWMGERPPSIEFDGYWYTGLICWYFLFYFPGDILYKICKFAPVKMLITISGAIHGLRSSIGYFETAHKESPDSYFFVFSTIMLGGLGPTLLMEFAMLCCEIQGHPSQFKKPTWNGQGKLFIALVLTFLTEQSVVFPLLGVDPLPNKLIYTLLLVLVIYQEVVATITGSASYIPFIVSIPTSIFHLLTQIPSQHHEQKHKVSSLNNSSSQTPAAPAIITLGKKKKVKKN